VIALTATAGQFVNIYLPGGAMLLPRPIGIADVQGDNLLLVYQVAGKGTAVLSKIEENDKIEIMGPLGTGFFDYPGSPTDPAELEFDDISYRILLIGGGVGVFPLYFAARRLKEELGDRVYIEAALGYREQPWFAEEFKRICDSVKIASEECGMDAFHGNVSSLLDVFPELRYTDLAIACGPHPMLEAVSGWCESKRVLLRVSLEERMGCGYGACAGCHVHTYLPGADEGRDNMKKVCCDGPVFWSEEVIW